MTRWWVRALVSAAVAAVLLTFIPIGEVWASMRQVRPWVWLAAVGVFVTGHAANAMKLRLFIGPRAVPAGPCLQAHFAGLAANLGLPGVAGGDFVRAAYLVPAAGATRVAVGSVADRVLDTVVLGVVVAVALPLAGLPPALAGLVWSGGWWLAVGLAGAAALGVVAWRLVDRSGRLPQLRQAGADLGARPGAVALAFLISLSVQSAFVLTNVWLAREVGVATAIAAWFVAWPGSKLSAILPISLGGIGVREATLVFLLVPYGAPPDGVLAAGILWEGVLITGGLGGLLVTQIARRQARSAPDGSPERSR